MGGSRKGLLELALEEIMYFTRWRLGEREHFSEKALKIGNGAQKSTVCEEELLIIVVLNVN